MPHGVEEDFEIISTTLFSKFLQQAVSEACSAELALLSAHQNI